MPTNRVKQAINNLGLPKFFSYLLLLIVILISAYGYFKIESSIQSLNYALSPPDLPKYVAIGEREGLGQSWSADEAEWFHFVSQGTATIPIPYKWFIALEQPESSPWLIFFGDQGRFKDDDYILRMGYIRGDVSSANPDGLPYGFAKTESQFFEGLDRSAAAVGFTCAACHTGHIVYDDVEYIVEGGPAMTDSGLFTKTLGAALGQTALSSKLPILNGRFKRFAARVLGEHNNVLTRAILKEHLLETVAQLASTSDTINVTEGFTRLDALNRIGNEVFSSNMNRHRNYAAIDAPVNFPHLWTASWFDWVQYDGSIMQPLTRNSGEALGVKAYVDMTAPLDGQRFASSIPINSLYKIENLLAGENPFKNREFSGLSAPKWPNTFPKIDEEKRAKGEVLYNQICSGCHLPTLKSEAIWKDDKYFKHITYSRSGTTEQTTEKYLHLKIIDPYEIGTDPSQASILANRTIDTTGVGLNTEVCTPARTEPDATGTDYTPYAVGGLEFVPIKDSSVANFGLALGALVQVTNDQWMRQNHIPEAWRPEYDGHRPNCLQLGKGYKARPLNGVWATAPFLHNGSVPTLYDLLSPLAERPKYVQLGNLEFDPKKVGIKQMLSVTDEIDKQQGKKNGSVEEYISGLFILDTQIRGNWNTGHQFEDSYVRRSRDPRTNPKGVIGRKLTEEEKMQIIEFLKTI